MGRDIQLGDHQTAIKTTPRRQQNSRHTRQTAGWHPAGLTFTLETFNKHWISCYSGDFLDMCVCVCTCMGKVQHRPWASVCLPLSAAVYRFPETRLTKRLNTETEESTRRRTTDTHTHTHTIISPLSSPSLLSVSLASGGCVLKSQRPKPGGASGVVKAAMCNATQTRERTTVQVECSIPPTRSPPRPHGRLKLKIRDNSKQRRHL